MTPQLIETRARSKYNAIGDSFFSQEELLDYLYQGCIELAQEALVIEGAPQTASTVVGQQSYDFPTNSIGIKRISYNGRKLKKVTFREDDALTGLDQSTTNQGTPQYYFEWNSVIYLRPIPSEIGTLKIFTFKEPDVIAITSSLEIPSRYHMGLVDFVVKEMCAKDKDYARADRLEAKWEKFVARAKAFEKKKTRGDSYNVVQDEDQLAEGFLGIV